MNISDELYKRDTKGKVRVWSAEIDGPRYRIISGLISGRRVTSAWKYTIGKNIGKSNETTPETQAEAEVGALFVKQCDKGYFHNLLDIDNAAEIPFKPMLASKYVPEKLVFPVYSQPKLDGVRCIANKNGLWTRAGKPIRTCGHVWDAVKKVFDWHPGLMLDGELYNHALRDDFNEIISLIRREKATDLQKEMTKTLVQYHVYDIVNDDDFKHRSARLSYISQQLYEDVVFENCGLPVPDNGIITIVPSRFCYNQKDLNRMYNLYMEDGYEGQIIRTNDVYENKRSKFLIKRKEFHDQEFKILRIEAGVGNWAGYAKRVTFELYDGRECGAGIKGNQAFTKSLLANKNDYDNGIVTIKYFKLTPDGMPRFPIAVAFYQNGRDFL